MKKTYMSPEIGVEKLKTESPLLGDSPTNQVTNVTGSDLRYGGGGFGPARVGENTTGMKRKKIPAGINCKTSSFTSQRSLHIHLMEAVPFHITPYGTP